MKKIVCLAALALAFSSSAWAGDKLTFTAPKAWKQEKTTRAMRLYEYVVPKSTGDSEDGKVIVYFFGGPMGGGNLDANIERWKKQTVPQAGDPAAKQTERVCNGHKVVILDQVGTYTPPSFRPNAPKQPPQPGRRIVNVYLETDDGKYFVKFIGPNKTVSDNADNFLKFLDSASPAGKAQPTSKPASRPTSRPS